VLSASAYMILPATSNVVWHLRARSGAYPYVWVS
jgi:hypothetical protein